MIALLIFLAGGTGATLRFSVDRLISARLKGDIPVATFFINATGSFALGLLTGPIGIYTSTHANGSAPWPADSLPLVLGLGFLGGYTTFSTAMIEAAQTQDAAQRLTLLVGQALICVLCAGAGLLLFLP